MRQGKNILLCVLLTVTHAQQTSIPPQADGLETGLGGWCTESFCTDIPKSTGESFLLYSSTCDQDSDWNYYAVATELKTWIGSIEVNLWSMPEDLAVSFFEVHAGEDKFCHLHSIGRLDQDENPVGNFWIAMGFSELTPFNNGFLYGRLDEHGYMTGEDIVYIYPDLKTVMVGHFHRGVMISAKSAKVVAERCHNGLKLIRLSRPEKAGPTFRYEQGSEFRVFGGQPTLVDPFETRHVYVADVEGFGEGLFAKRNLREGSVIGYNAAFLFDVDERSPYHDNMTEIERSCISHKINHSFKSANCVFDLAFNPRFGRVQALHTLRDIRKGEQLFLNYKYPIHRLDPPWYVDAYLREVGPLPENAARHLMRYQAGLYDDEDYEYEHEDEDEHLDDEEEEDSEEEWALQEEAHDLHLFARDDEVEEEKWKKN